MAKDKLKLGFSLSFGDNSFVAGDKVSVDTVENRHLEGTIMLIQPYRCDQTGEVVCGFLLDTSDPARNRSLSFELVMADEVELMKRL